jgi:hypothetical protein
MSTMETKLEEDKLARLRREAGEVEGEAVVPQEPRPRSIR